PLLQGRSRIRRWHRQGDGYRFHPADGRRGVTLPISAGRRSLLPCRRPLNNSMRAAHAHLWRSGMSNRIAAKLLAEFIGTFALIFIGAGAAAVVGGAGLAGVAAIAFAHGLTVLAFAFAYGPVSGGHFNPSVTTAVLAAGAIRAGEAAGYIVSQLVGGLLGALL